MRVDDVSGRCSHHVITRHGFARHSVDARRRAPPGDGSGVAGRSDCFRRGVPLRSTLPPSLVGPRRDDDDAAGGGAQITLSPTAPSRGQVVFTDVDMVVLPNRAATSSPPISRVAEVAGHQRVAEMPLRREQQSPEPAVGRRSTSMMSRIASPRSSKSKSSAEKRAAASAAVSGNEQAKKGERLSNYSKGLLPPTRSRPPKSPPPPPPIEVAMTAADGWVNGVAPPPVNSRPWQSAKRPGGSPAMDILVEDPGELPSPSEQSGMKSKNSPKHRTKQLKPIKLDSPNLRPRTQSMPAGSSSFVAGSHLRPSKDGHSPPLVTFIPHNPTASASTVVPRQINSTGVSSSSDSSLPVTPQSANGRIPGSPRGAWIPKLPTPTDNDTRNYPFHCHQSQ